MWVDIDESFDEDFCVEYESFSFDPIQTDFPFESCMSEFVKADNLIMANFDFEQTLTPFEIRGLMDFRPIILARLLIPTNNHISRSMTTLLDNIEYICLIPNWA